MVYNVLWFYSLIQGSKMSFKNIIFPTVLNLNLLGHESNTLQAELTYCSTHIWMDGSYINTWFGMIWECSDPLRAWVKLTPNPLLILAALRNKCYLFEDPFCNNNIFQAHQQIHSRSHPLIFNFLSNIDYYFALSLALPVNYHSLHLRAIPNSSEVQIADSRWR